MIAMLVFMVVYRVLLQVLVRRFYRIDARETGISTTLIADAVVTASKRSSSAVFHRMIVNNCVANCD